MGQSLDRSQFAAELTSVILKSSLIDVITNDKRRPGFIVHMDTYLARHLTSLTL